MRRRAPVAGAGRVANFRGVTPGPGHGTHRAAVPAGWDREPQDRTERARGRIYKAPRAGSRA